MHTLYLSLYIYIQTHTHTHRICDGPDWLLQKKGILNGKVSITIIMIRGKKKKSVTRWKKYVSCLTYFILPSTHNTSALKVWSSFTTVPPRIRIAYWGDVSTMKFYAIGWWEDERAGLETRRGRWRIFRTQTSRVVSTSAHITYHWWYIDYNYSRATHEYCSHSKHAPVQSHTVPIDPILTSVWHNRVVKRYATCWLLASKLIWQVRAICSGAKCACTG